MSGEANLETLLKCAADSLQLIPETLEFRAGNLVLEQGYSPSRVYLIQAGLTAAIYGSANGQDCLIALNGEGETLGDLEYLQYGTPAVCTVHAVKDSRLWAFSYAQMDSLVKHKPEILRQLGIIMAKRLTAATQRVSSSIVYPLEYNLLKLLLSQDQAGPQLAKSEVAAWLGHSERHISRLVKNLELEGIIIRQARFLRLKDRKKARQRMLELEA